MESDGVDSRVDAEGTELTEGEDRAWNRWRWMVLAVLLLRGLQVRNCERSKV